MRYLSCIGAALALLGSNAAAEVVRIEVQKQQEWAGGQRFKAGPYELVAGTAWYEIDPNGPEAKQIADVKLAPRNARGKVEYHGPFLLLRPKQAGTVKGATFFEIANRGGDQSNRFLYYTDQFSLTHPERTTEVGHGPMFDRGYTFAWAGWQANLKADEFGLTVPKAKIRSIVRATEFLSTENSAEDAGNARVGGSCAADVNDPGAVLRIQRSYDDPGVIIPRAEWRFATRDKDGKVSPDPCAFLLSKPVAGAAMATLTYTGDEPLVAGLGLAAIRDFASYLRANEIAGQRAPSTIIAYGYSQSGRFLRDFLYRGFNRAADGRRVFDGVLDTASGAGRGSFAHRYAVPGDAGNSVGSALRPVDLYPFADLPTADISGKRREGLLDRAMRDGVVPKIFHIFSGSEYWARAGSLIQATPDGRASLPEAQGTRIYAFAGTNHAPRASISFMEDKPGTAWPYNDNYDLLASLPALTESMRRWIEEGAEPFPSQRPEVGTTLVEPAKLAFPKLSGVTVPKAPPPVWQLDFGPKYHSEGIVAEPPKIGPRYNLLVPQVDEDGNDVGGWHGLRRSVPLGTYTAWNVSYSGVGAFGLLSGLAGAFFPFSFDPQEAKERGDPRRSMIERYGSRLGYMRAVEKEMDRQIAAGFLLPDERQWTRDQMLINWAGANATAVAQAGERK